MYSTRYTWNGCDYDMDDFEPSTDIAAAWEVVQRFPCIKIVKNEFGYAADIDGRFIETSGTAPHAICLAALRACGHEF
jgi:hypothetical protein